MDILIKVPNSFICLISFFYSIYIFCLYIILFIISFVALRATTDTMDTNERKCECDGERHQERVPERLSDLSSQPRTPLTVSLKSIFMYYDLTPSFFLSCLLFLFLFLFLFLLEDWRPQWRHQIPRSAMCFYKWYCLFLLFIYLLSFLMISSGTFLEDLQRVRKQVTKQPKKSTNQKEKTNNINIFIIGIRVQLIHLTRSD